MFPSLFLVAAMVPLGATTLDLVFAGQRAVDPGCVVDIRQDHMPPVRRAMGMADLEVEAPLTPDTVFEAGSVSKQFIGALAAILAERGRLSLDESVRHWLPELSEIYQPITIRMLLHHTSGIRDWSVLTMVTGWPRGTRLYEMADVLALLADQQELNFEPGTEYLYSNSNYVLAALIVERAAGEPLGLFAESALFQPLGLGHTRWRTDYRSIVKGRAKAYSPDGEGGWLLDMPSDNVVGPGGLLTTVDDLQRWNGVIAAGRESWVRAMRQPGSLRDGSSVPYGLGLVLSPLNGRRAISHSGASAGYRAWLAAIPDEKLSIAMLCNAATPEVEQLWPQLLAGIIPATPAPVLSALDAVPDGVEGIYRDPASDLSYNVTLRADGLLAIGAGVFPYMADPAGSARPAAGIKQGPDGVVQGLIVTRPGNSPLRLERAAAWSPSPLTLQPLAGTYLSREMGTAITLTVSGGVLSFQAERGDASPLQPTLTDTFAIPGWQLRIIRDQAGQVEALRLSNMRARQMVFQRALPPPD